MTVLADIFASFEDKRPTLAELKAHPYFATHPFDPERLVRRDHVRAENVSHADRSWHFYLDDDSEFNGYPGEPLIDWATFQPAPVRWYVVRGSIGTVVDVIIGFAMADVAYEDGAARLMSYILEGGVAWPLTDTTPLTKEDAEAEQKTNRESYQQELRVAIRELRA